MTPKQILDSFSETLMQDERILSVQEHSLLATLLQHAKAASGQSVETQQAVRAVIASAVGETVAQRAFAVLGGSIVERILESSVSNDAGTRGSTASTTELMAPPPTQPQPPGVVLPPSPSQPQPPGKMPPQPQPPGVHVPPKAPSHTHPKPPKPPLRDTPVGPPKQPQPPGGGSTDVTVVSEGTTAVQEQPPLLSARCVVLDEFLAPQELEEIMHFVLENEAGFAASEVVSPRSAGGVVDYEHRRSRVLIDVGQYQDLMLNRIKGVLPQVLQKLGMEEFSIAAVEAQVTASNDGDFFHFHSDSGSGQVASRYLTFVYFFHREPRQFEGGELLIHDACVENGSYVSAGSYQTITPQQNQIVFFPCELMHEIAPVKCPSRLFADSRFTLNGWLRR